MSSLNLHLDFMNEQEPPVRYIELTAEEERQIVEDSTKLMRQIDEDYRLLDRMCSALENLFIIQRHYEEFGSSPALEALVGDIHEVLGISVEADEAKPESTSDSDGNEKGGGLGGAISKVWDWIVNLFRRIGEWLNIVDKKVTSDCGKIESKLKDIDLSKHYMVKHVKPLYQNGSVGNLPDCSGIESAFKTALSNASFGGGESTGVEMLEKAIEGLRPYTELIESEIKGSDIKTLYQNTRALWKNVYKMNKTVGSGLTQIQDNMNSGKKPRKKDEKAKFEKLANTLKKSINYIKLTMHRVAVSVSAISKTLYGVDNQKGRSDADIANEQQEKDKLIEQGRQEQKEREAQEKAQARSKKKK